MHSRAELIDDVITKLSNPRTEVELIFADNVLFLLHLNQVEKLVNFLYLQIEILKEFKEPTDQDFEKNEIQAALDAVGFALFWSPYTLKSEALAFVLIFEKLNDSLFPHEIERFTSAYYEFDAELDVAG